MYLVIYKRDGCIDGIVDTKQHFDMWLKAENMRRISEGEEPYSEFEYELTYVERL